MSDTLLGARPDNDEDSKAHPADWLDALFRDQGSRMVRLLTRRAGGHAEASDLVAEAFLHLTQAARRQVLVNPEHYLKTITRNLLRNRAKSVRGAIERGHVELEPERHAAHDGDPHQVLEAAQTLALYETAMLKLKPKTREIYLLHRLDDLSYAEIAARMGLSVSAIEKHMMDAIGDLDRAVGHLRRRRRGRR